MTHVFSLRRVRKCVRLDGKNSSMGVVSYIPNSSSLTAGMRMWAVPITVIYSSGDISGCCYEQTSRSDSLYCCRRPSDWRSLSQVKELGVVFYDCERVATDVRKVFEMYWLAANVRQLPPQWPLAHKHCRARLFCGLYIQT